MLRKRRVLFYFLFSCLIFFFYLTQNARTNIMKQNQNQKPITNDERENIMSSLYDSSVSSRKVAHYPGHTLALDGVRLKRECGPQRSPRGRCHDVCLVAVCGVLLWFESCGLLSAVNLKILKSAARQKKGGPRGTWGYPGENSPIFSCYLPPNIVTGNYRYSGTSHHWIF